MPLCGWARFIFKELKTYVMTGIKLKTYRI